MKIHNFNGIYQERWGFSWAMLVSGRVYLGGGWHDPWHLLVPGFPEGMDLPHPQDAGEIHEDVGRLGKHDRFTPPISVAYWKGNPQLFQGNLGEILFHLARSMFESLILPKSRLVGCGLVSWRVPSLILFFKVWYDLFHQAFQVPKMEESAPMDTQNGYGLWTNPPPILQPGS